MSSLFMIARLGSLQPVAARHRPTAARWIQVRIVSPQLLVWSHSSRCFGPRRNAERSPRGMLRPCSHASRRRRGSASPSSRRVGTRRIAPHVSRSGITAIARASRLAALDDRELDDVGLSRAERRGRMAESASGRPDRSGPRPFRRALLQEGVHAFAEVGAGVGVADQVVDVLVAHLRLQAAQRLLGGRQRDRRMAGQRRGQLLGARVQGGLSGSISLTSPICSAVGASTSLARNIISLTRCGPTSAASRA